MPLRDRLLQWTRRWPASPEPPWVRRKRGLVHQLMSQAGARFLALCRERWGV